MSLLSYERKINWHVGVGLPKYKHVVLFETVWNT